MKQKNSYQAPELQVLPLALTPYLAGSTDAFIAPEDADVEDLW